MLLILFIVFIYSNLSQVACVKSIIWQPIIYLILKKNGNTNANPLTRLDNIARPGIFLAQT
jgi:hypothetical protein